MRGPPVSSRKRSESPVAICSTESIRTRAAASSIASGSPSSSAQIAATEPASSGLSSKSGRTSAARSTNSDTASDPAKVSPPSAGSDSDGTRQSVSPPTPSGARLVASTTTSGAAHSSASAASAHASPQVLAVVEHEQRPAGGEIGARGLELRHARQRTHPQRLRDRRPDQPLVSQRRQLDPPAAVGVAVQGLGGGLQREPRLAAAARAGQGQQPWSASRRASSPSSRSRPMKLDSCTGRLLGSASSGR